jgi:Kef-type K+ transport system membrane component KefB/ABC-type siderophore export system fused ATPase/permease subunit
MTPHRTQVYQAIVCSILNKIFDLAPPALIGMAVDVVVKKQNSLIASWGFQSIPLQLGVLSFLTLLIWGAESLFQYCYDHLWRNLAQTTQHELRIEAYGHLQELEMSFFEERSTGQLLSILNDDINQLERFLDTGANDILQVVTTVIVVGGAFFILAPQVAWMAMLPMPFVIWGSFWFQSHLAPRYREVRNRSGFVNMRLANNLAGIATIKSFTAEPYERERVEIDSEAYRRSNAHAIVLSAAFIPLIRVLILLGFTGTLYFGGLSAANGQMAVGTYSVLVFITQRLLWPLTSLGATLDQYQRAMASTQRVMGLLDTPIAIRAGHRSLPAGTAQGAVDFEHITFAYTNRSPALRNLSLHIPAGKTIGVVGATGSGKSTLVKLLLRFYEVQEGCIRVDGVDIRELNLRDLRQNRLQSTLHIFTLVNPFNIWFMPLPLTDPVYLFTVVLLSLTLAPIIGRRIQLPPLIVLILLGIALGPHGLANLFPHGTDNIGILDRIPPMQLLERIGLLYIMLLAGLQMNLKDLRQVGLRALIFGGLTFSLPFVAGISLAFSLHYPLITGLLMGTLFSAHVLISYPILLRLNITKVECVSVAIGGTVVTSFLTLAAFSIIQSLGTGNLTPDLWIKLILGLPILTVLVIWGAPKVLDPLFAKMSDNLGESFVLVLAVLFIVASCTLLLGVDSIVGAFIAGLALNSILVQHPELVAQVERVGVNLFIPCFLLSVGLLCNPQILVQHPENLGLAVLVILTAVGSKFLAAWLSGFSFKYGFTKVMILTSLTMSRAALVLVISVYGKSHFLPGTQTPILQEGLFNTIVVYILVTCLVGPLLTQYFGRQIQASDYENQIA